MASSARRGDPSGGGRHEVSGTTRDRRSIVSRLFGKGMSKLDVVMIGPFPVDESRIEGGVQASLYGLCRRLSKHPDVATLRVVAVTKLVGREVVRSTLAGVDVTYLRAPWRFMTSMIANLPMILRIVAEFDEPVVHLHGSGLFEALILLSCRIRSIPLVWTMHGITEKETLESWRRHPGAAGLIRHLIYRTCERLQLRFARTIVVDTPYVANEIAGRTATKPLTIPQGIFLDELAAARNTARTGKTILALGVIDPRKGHVLTVEAFARVVRRVPDARLRIVGALTSVGHLAEIHEAIHRHDLSANVEILVDQPRAAVLEALAEARVFALHSQEESQGIAICEALAVGLPVVATRVGGIPDVVGDDGAGVLVDYGDIDGFADAIVRLITDDEAAAHAGAAALARGAEFDWDRIARRIVGLYEDARAARS